MGSIHPYSSKNNQLYNFFKLCIVSMPLLQNYLYMFTKYLLKATFRLSSQKRPVVSVVSQDSLCTLKGVPRRGEQSQVESFPTRVTPHLKCICNGIYKQSITFLTIICYYMKCLYHALDATPHAHDLSPNRLPHSWNAKCKLKPVIGV